MSRNERRGWPAPRRARSRRGRRLGVVTRAGSCAAPSTRDHAERHVDQEDHAPAGAEQVGVDQAAGHDRAERSRPGPSPGRTRRTPCPSRAAGTWSLISPKTCGSMIAPNGALERRGRRSARRRWAQRRTAADASAKPVDADEQHPPPAEEVAEPAAGERARPPSPACSRRRSTARRSSSRRGRRGSSAPAIVDDRRVEQVHDLGDQDDAQGPATASGRPAARRGRRGGSGGAAVVADTGASGSVGQRVTALFVTNTVRHERRSCQVDCAAMASDAAPPRSRRNRPAKAGAQPRGDHRRGARDRLSTRASMRSTMRRLGQALDTDRPRCTCTSPTATSCGTCSSTRRSARSPPSRPIRALAHAGHRPRPPDGQDDGRRLPGHGAPGWLRGSRAATTRCG